MSQCGHVLLVPVVIDAIDWRESSEHERGTMVEAIIGATYEREDFQLTNKTRDVTNHILDLLSTSLESPDAIFPFEQTQILRGKKSKTVLLELLQSFGITNANMFFTTKKYGNILYNT
jgi:hypothetical protein